MMLMSGTEPPAERETEMTEFTPLEWMADFTVVGCARYIGPDVGDLKFGAIVEVLDVTSGHLWEVEPGPEFVVVRADRASQRRTLVGKVNLKFL